MSEVATAFPGDLGSPHIPDPGFTASEAINVMGVVLSHIRVSDAGGDTVLESAWQKLSEAVKQIDQEEIARVEAEVEMADRFREDRSE